MAITSYRFVSPGVQVQEIDNSQIPAVSTLTGPTVVGRFEKGPSMRPVYITSFSQFVETFGNPIPGNTGEDVWRDGNYLAPTYAAYAAQAWLRNTPALNVVRLVGTQHSNVTSNNGKAGWTIDLGYQVGNTGGGAYGLFVIPSGSTPTTAVTGTLAAIFYVESGSIALSGAVAGTEASPVYAQGSNILIKSAGGFGEFRAVITTPTETYTSNFNFDNGSDKYLRKVFNTNPVLTNAEITTTTNIEHYWLGETFERSVDETISNFSNAGTVTYAFVAPLVSGSVDLRNHKIPARSAKTGWVFGQDLTNNTGSFSPTAQQKLFRFSTLDSGEYEQRSYKVSISDIKAPATDFDDYGTFTVSIRQASDTDNAPKFTERYGGVNLNPASPNYIARRIGDKYVTWDDTQKRLREYGTYNNASTLIRIEMNEDLDAGSVDPTYLPFGFYGAPRFKNFSITSASGSINTNPLNTPVSSAVGAAYNVANFLHVARPLTASIVFPAIPLRQNAADGAISDPRNAYFGITTGEKTATTTFDYTYADLTRASVHTDYEVGTTAYLENSFMFTLDDVSGSSASTIGAVYVSGSRVAGTSLTAVSSSYRGVLSNGYNSFTMPLFNGFDGFDVTESEPLRNTLMATNPTELNNSVYYTYKRAIDTLADPEAIITDIITIPGLTETTLTNHLIATCEARADVLAIIDLPNVYTPEAEGTATSRTTRYIGTAANAADALKDRGLNSSYGATYYPWVQIRDTIANRVLFVPPSVVALGAMSYGQSSQELWFAPAGFTRGGLSEGRGGIPVLGVTEKLSSKDRDTLYEANINPIAQFPAEGIVIFGQKTLQVTPSALDRINVRRMMIFVKREISKIASRLLFDQNVDVTWSRFKGQVNPFLGTVKSRLGLTDYRVILDSTTTTPDLVDRNIMYAKIFLKPARAIEFIAIDFTITDSGASFAD